MIRIRNKESAVIVRNDGRDGIRIETLFTCKDGTKPHNTAYLTRFRAWKLIDAIKKAMDDQAGDDE